MATKTKVAVIAVLLAAGLSWSAPADAVGVFCPEPAVSDPVGAITNEADHEVEPHAGPDGVGVVFVETSDDCRDEWAVVVNGSGVTITGDVHDGYWVYEHEVRLGSDGYHEHSDGRYDGPSSGTGADACYRYTQERSITTDGYDERTEEASTPNDGGYEGVDHTYVDINPDGGVGANKAGGETDLEC